MDLRILTILDRSENEEDVEAQKVSPEDDLFNYTTVTQGVLLYHLPEALQTGKLKLELKLTATSLCHHRGRTELANLSLRILSIAKKKNYVFYNVYFPQCQGLNLGPHKC